MIKKIFKLICIFIFIFSCILNIKHGYCKDCFSTICSSEEWEEYHRKEAEWDNQYHSEKAYYQWKAFMDGHGFDDVYRAEPPNVFEYGKKHPDNRW